MPVLGLLRRTARPVLGLLTKTDPQARLRTPKTDLQARLRNLRRATGLGPHMGEANAPQGAWVRPCACPSTGDARTVPKHGPCTYSAWVDQHEHPQLGARLAATTAAVAKSQTDASAPTGRISG